MILAYFSKYLTNFAVIFCPSGRKCNCWEIFQKSFKIFQKSLRKIAKNVLLYHVFKICHYQFVWFSRVWTKNTISWKVLRKLSKISSWNRKNQLFLHIFQANLTNHSLISLGVWTKTQFFGKFWEDFENLWWKFYWKIEFLFYFYFLFFEKIVSKDRAFGNNTSFLQQGFRFRRGEGDFPHLAPGYSLGTNCKLNSVIQAYFDNVSFFLWMCHRSTTATQFSVWHMVAR